MGSVVKKITKPISKVLDKIVPNEIKPLLPYAAAFAPFMLGPAAGMAGGQGLGALLRRGILTGALPNIGAQLAQEGNEGELNPLSVLMSTASAGLSGQGAGDTLRGMMNPGKAVPIPGGNMPGQTLGGFKYDASGISGLDKAKNFMLKGGAKLADAAGGAAKTLNDPFAADTKLLDIAKAGAVPFSQATGDLAYAEGTRALKEFNAAEAAQQVMDAATKAGMDQEYIDAITSSMGDYGYDQEDINEILRIRGLFASGGRVGYAIGGGIMETPEADFISMDEVVENVDGDKIEDSFEGATAEGYKLNDFEFQQDVFDSFGLKLYNLKDDPELGSFDEAQVREMLYGDQYASGGVINAYNMGGSVLPQGMEMDYRQGGMIPMGSKERADDVPARVSKNEFVMTADAVRAAGGGSVNKGAQKMYQLMNNLEART